MKNFFGITSRYRFEIYDVTALITLLNVCLVIAGFKFAPVFGIINGIICMILNVKGRAHINSYLTQLALIILNTYFLIG